MCGRYVIVDTDKIAERFEANSLLDGIKPNYNAAPTQRLPIVYQEGNERLVDQMKWGFIPGWWSKPEPPKFTTINAISEEVDAKPFYRGAFKQQRCLVPANGCYEWQQQQGGRQPYFFGLEDRSLFALAGLYSPWKLPSGEEWLTFTILTTKPNNPVSLVHGRMPVILKRKDEEAWLDPGLGRDRAQADAPALPR